MKLFAAKPCQHCPWKKSSKVGGGNIPNFSLSMMERLAETAPKENVSWSEKDDFRKIFACHNSKEGKECACAGYVARDGMFNLNIRLLAAQNNINLRSIIEEAEKYDLYDNFHQMLIDYRLANKKS